MRTYSKRHFFLIQFLLVLPFTVSGAEPVQNPYHDKVDWKDWQADPQAVPSAYNPNTILSLEPRSGWQQPMDVTPAEAEAGQFLKFVPYHDVDPLERKYTGFNHYFYGNGDEGHSPLRDDWSVNGPNSVHNLRDAVMYYPVGSFGVISAEVMEKNGLTFGNNSIKGASNYTGLLSSMQYLDEDVYFRNTTLLGPTAGFTFPYAYAPNILVVRGGVIQPPIRVSAPAGDGCLSPARNADLRCKQRAFGLGVPGGVETGIALPGQP